MSLRHIPRLSGVYAIVNSTNGKRYVGSAENLYTRAHSHFSVLRNGKHSNAHLQSAFAASGAGAFQFVVIELAQRDALREREQHFIDSLKAVDPSHGYNMASAVVRIVFDDATRDKLRTCKPGRKLHEETKRKISQTLTGRKLGPFSDEHRRKIAEALKGKKKSAAHCARMSEAGKRQDPASRAHPHTEETKRRISELAKRRPPFSAEHCAKISAALTGKKRGPPSAATRRLIAEAHLRRRERSAGL